MLLVLLIAAFGGFTGLVFAGPAGLVLGTLVGYGIAYGFRQFVIRRGQEIIQRQYFNATFAVMGHACRTDPGITGDEIWAANQVFDRLGLSGEPREAARAAFDAGRGEDFDLNAELAALRRVAGGHRTLLPAFIQAQYWALGAGGELHEQGRELIGRFASALVVSETELRRIEAMLRSGRQDLSDQQRLEDARTILDVGPDSGEDQVQKTGRGLLNQHDPELLIGQGMPVAMHAVIEERGYAIERARKALAQGQEQAA